MIPTGECQRVLFGLLQKEPGVNLSESHGIDDKLRQKCLNYSLMMGYIVNDFTGEPELTNKGKTFLLNTIKDAKW
jgi:hypothetical protein